MKIVRIPRKDNKVDFVKVWNTGDFPYNSLPATSIGSPSKRYKYANFVMTFDIETTTIKCERPFGFMYIWQACVNGECVMGRTWEDFFYLLERLRSELDLSNKKRLCIYIHNASYEIQFMKDFLIQKYGKLQILASNKRKVITCSCDFLEFRCSYLLSNMNLAKAVQNELGTIHRKAIGDLDYRKLRTCNTNLNQTELGYCIADVVTLYEYITCKLKNEGDTLASIPVTSTGFVRRDVRNSTREDTHYRQFFKKLAYDSTIQKMLYQAGRGGNTHSFRCVAGRIFEWVDSFDIASSYPWQLVSRMFPVGKWMNYGKIKHLKELNALRSEGYALLFSIVLTDVRIKKGCVMPYIPESKCIHLLNPRRDNGRVLFADALSITVTDIDFDIINKQYDYESISVGYVYICKYGMLPDVIRNKVLSYFRDKSELKYKIEHTEEQEEKENLQYLYAKSKNRLNGIFGMMYTDPIREEITINEDGEWVTEDLESMDMDEALRKYWKSRNSFLSYAWGVWCTAWARLSLEDLIDATSSGEDSFCIYCDTDSSKCFNPNMQLIDDLNEKIKRKAEEVGAYVDVEGKRYYMGLYEHETSKERYKKFVTLGAKKYAYEDSDGLHITIAGVNKKEGAKELGCIENFKPNFIFRDAGGKTLYYNDDKIKTIHIDGATFTTASNIGMVDSEYTLGITREYAELIGFNYLTD